MNFDLALSKILAKGKYTPSEIQALLAEAGCNITMGRLSDYLNRLVVLGVAAKFSDNTYSSQPY